MRHATYCPRVPGASYLLGLIFLGASISAVANWIVADATAAASR